MATGTDILQRDITELFGKFQTFVQNMMISKTWASLMNSVLYYATRLFILLCVIDFCWSMGIEYLQRGSFELGTFLSSLAHELLFLGIGVWFFLYGPNLMAQCLYFLSVEGQSFATDIINASEILANGAGTIKSNWFNPMYSINVGIRICNDLVAAAPQIVTEQKEMPHIIGELFNQFRFGELIGYTQGVVCLMQFVLVGAALCLMIVEGCILLSISPLYLAFFPLKATRQKAIEFMWGLLALGVKVLLAYVCAAIANGIGETVILNYVGKLKAAYVGVSTSVPTGYIISCALVSAFCVFIAKFATELPGDCTRTLSWMAAGSAASIAVGAGVATATSSTTEGLKGSSAAVREGSMQHSNALAGAWSGGGNAVAGAVDVATSLMGGGGGSGGEGGNVPNAVKQTAQTVGQGVASYINTGAGAQAYALDKGLTGSPLDQKAAAYADNLAQQFATETPRSTTGGNGGKRNSPSVSKSSGVNPQSAGNGVATTPVSGEKTSTPSNG